MKLFLIASLLLSGITINRNVFTDTLTEALTRAAPTLSTEGEPLNGDAGAVYSYRLTLCAPAGQTLSGAGTIDLWYYNTATAWSIDPGLVLTASVSGKRCQTFPDVPVGPPTGRFLAAPNGITTSSGTTVTVRYDMEIR